MAIAGLVLMTTPEGYPAIMEALSGDAKVTDIRPVEEGSRIAAVLEAPSQDMENEISRLLAWEGMLTVDIALLTYEDEVAEGKEIQCPPHKPRKTWTAQKA